LTGHSQYRDSFPASPIFTGTDSRQLICHVRDRPGHDRRYAIDFSKAARELGYSPARDLVSGLTATVDWYLREVAWWRRLLGRDYAEWLRKNYDA
jgi:dTDP-glucose 4,6-dehydratase